MPSIDRLVSFLGAKRIVAGKPGLGWMLVEFFPVFIWSRITGAISLENTFYLVGFLTLLGASDSDRSWLLVIFGSAVVLQTGVVLKRYRRASKDPALAKRHCVRDSWISRSVWVAGLLWPLLGQYLELGKWWLLGGFFACAFVGQLFFFTSLSAWTTWTRELVPTSVRGPFFAWRNISGFFAYAGVTALIAIFWPSDVAAGDAELWWYCLLFGFVSIPCLISTRWLAACPAGESHPADEDVTQAPLKEVLRSHPALWTYTGWNIFHTMAMACTLVYIPDLIMAAQVGTDDYAGWETIVRNPLSLLGMICAGMWLRHVGSFFLMIMMSICICIGLICYLSLDSSNAHWLLPLALGFEAVGRSFAGIAFMTRLYEVIPRGDPRIPSLFLAMGASMMTITALLIPYFISYVKATWPSLEPAWALVAVGLGLRVLSIPFLLDRRKVEDQDEPRNNATP